MVKGKMKGTCYNISLNEKSVLKGWVLIITDDGEEFLLQRNTKLSFNFFRKVYQTDYSFKPYALVRKVSYPVSSSIGVVLGIGLVRIFGGIIPMSIVFGEVNRPISYIQGLINMLILIGSIGLSFFLVKIYRKKRMELFLKQNNAKLVPYGKIKATTYIQKFYNGIEVW